MSSFFKRSSATPSASEVLSSSSLSAPPATVKHVAGASVPKSIALDSSSLSLAELTLRENQTWSKCPSESFHLRVGPNYSSNKKKAPSPQALLEMVGVDFFSCESRIDNIASLVKIPEEWPVLAFTSRTQPPIPRRATATVFKPCAPSKPRAISAVRARSIKSFLATACGEPELSSSPVK